MKTTGERLKEIMKERGLKQVDILKLSLPIQERHGVKMGKSALSQYVNDVQSPDQHRISLLAETLDVSEPWLMGYDVKKERRSATDSQPSIFFIYNELSDKRQQKVYSYAERQLEEQNNEDKVLEFPTPYHTQETTIEDLFGCLSAGTGQYIYDNPIEQVEIPTSIIPDRDYDIMLRVVGDSMEPTFADGEYVFVKKTPNVRSGQFGAVIIDNEAYLKKIYIEDDHLRLVSLNEDYEDIIADGSLDVNLVGVIVL